MDWQCETTFLLFRHLWGLKCQTLGKTSLCGPPRMEATDGEGSPWYESNLQDNIGQFSVWKTEGGRRSCRISLSLETLPGYVEMPLIFNRDFLKYTIVKELCVTNPNRLWLLIAQGGREPSSQQKGELVSALGTQETPEGCSWGFSLGSSCAVSP